MVDEGEDEDEEADGLPVTRGRSREKSGEIRQMFGCIPNSTCLEGEKQTVNIHSRPRRLEDAKKS
jgi:hypothetical protein